MRRGQCRRRKKKKRLHLYTLFLEWTKQTTSYSLLGHSLLALDMATVCCGKSAWQLSRIPMLCRTTHKPELWIISDKPRILGGNNPILLFTYIRRRFLTVWASDNRYRALSNDFSETRGSSVLIWLPIYSHQPMCLAAERNSKHGSSWSVATREEVTWYTMDDKTWTVFGAASSQRLDIHD